MMSSHRNTDVAELTQVDLCQVKVIKSFKGYGLTEEIAWQQNFQDDI